MKEAMAELTTKVASAAPLRVRVTKNFTTVISLDVINKQL